VLQKKKRELFALGTSLAKLEGNFGGLRLCEEAVMQEQTIASPWGML